MELFHIEIMELQEIFEKNGYDNNFSDRCLRTFLNKIYSKIVPQHTVPKKDIYIFLPYLIVALSKISFGKKLSVTFFPVSIEK